MRILDVFEVGLSTFYTSSVVYMYSVAICVFPQQSTDDGLSGSKHVVN
jgi:hypothetical protein